MKKYVMALDSGTTSVRAIIFDKAQNIVYIAQKEFTQIYPQLGWVEHDPEEIFSAQKEVMLRAVSESGIGAEEIAAIGITNQRETTLVWDRTSGKCIYNAIVWQCRRTAQQCEKLLSDGYAEEIQRKTGLIIDAYFSATKIDWILSNVPGARQKAEEGGLAFGTVDSWLLYKLTNGAVHLTDYTNASRTMLFDIHRLEWDEGLLELFNIPASLLPKVAPSSSFFGETEINGVKIPITGLAGDQQSALYGQGCKKSGQAKNTYGTGCFLLMNTGKTSCESKNGLVSTLAASGNSRPDYAIEGSVFTAGSLIQWLRDEMGLIQTSAESEQYANEVSNNAGVYIVPAFTGLGAPYWDMHARGAIYGLTRGAGKAHIIRAALEAIAYQTKDVLDAIYKDTQIKVESLFVDGGASANNFLMQFQADILGIAVVRPSITETTAFGAALLAGEYAGFWGKEAYSVQSSKKLFTPQMDESTVEKNLSGWEQCVKRTLTSGEI